MNALKALLCTILFTIGVVLFLAFYAVAYCYDKVEGE